MALYKVEVNVGDPAGGYGLPLSIMLSADNDEDANLRAGSVALLVGMHNPYATLVDATVSPYTDALDMTTVKSCQRVSG